MQELERVPLIRKIATPADIMDLEEIQHHICQYCKLWTLYTDMSIQLKRASKLPQDEAVAACKIYGSHVLDVLKQFDEIAKLFAIENELKAIQSRELLPFPTISPHEERIESKRDKDKLIHEVDEEIVEVLKIIQSIKLNYQKERETKQKEQQARLARQPNRPEFNTFAVNTSTPIRNTNMPTQTGTNQQQLMEAAVTFDPSPVCHLYPTTDPISREGRYEPPANDSIIRRAAHTPTNQIMTNTTNAAGHNEPWRYNNRANMDT